MAELVSARPTLHGRALRILLVDDDENYAELVRRALSAADVGFELHHVTDGDLALDVLLGRGKYADRAAHPLPDVVFLDERMPRMDGSAVLEVLAANKTAPDDRRALICHMTSGPRASLTNRCHALGATFCIAKPMSYNQLKDKLLLMMDFFAKVLELPLDERDWY